MPKDVDEKLQKDRAEHIQEELWKVRARTYHLIVSFMVHAAPVMTIVFLYEFAMILRWRQRLGTLEKSAT